MGKKGDLYRCQGSPTCGYMYDPSQGDKKGKIPKDTLFDDLPEEWRCPICGAGKEKFRGEAGPDSSTKEEG